MYASSREPSRAPLYIPSSAELRADILARDAEKEDPALRKAAIKAAEEEKESALIRGHTLSRQIVENIYIDWKEFSGFFQKCIGNGEVRSSGSGIYWNSIDKTIDKQGRNTSIKHLSMHYGGSKNSVGAIHFKYFINPHLNKRVMMSSRVFIHESIPFSEDENYIQFGHNISVEIVEINILKKQLKQDIIALNKELNHEQKPHLRKIIIELIDETNNELKEIESIIGTIHKIINCLQSYIQSYIDDEIRRQRSQTNLRQPSETNSRNPPKSDKGSKSIHNRRYLTQRSQKNSRQTSFNEHRKGTSFNEHRTRGGKLLKKRKTFKKRKTLKKKH